MDERLPRILTIPDVSAIIVSDGVTIGDGAVIGAGAVVSKDIPPYAIAVGCPIEIKKYRLTEKQIAAMLRIQWWNWDEKKLKDVREMFNDIDAFITKYDMLQNSQPLS